MSSSQEDLTTQEFADKAGVSKSTVSKWLRTEKIRGNKKSGKWVVPASELSKIVASNAKPLVKQQRPSPKASQPNTGSYTIKEFSEMTYLTEFGVEKWLKEGRLVPAKDGTGKPMVDAYNLDLPAIKRLVR